MTVTESTNLEIVLQSSQWQPCFVCFLLQTLVMGRRVKNVKELRLEEKQVLTVVCDTV